MEYKRNGLNITIKQDDYPESPREWDNMGVMICSHNRYKLGDEQFNPDDHDGWAELEKYLYEERKAAIVLPLSLYDHSGITMSVGVSSGWDSGQVGFIYCTQAEIDREWEGDVKKAEAYLEGEVSTYDTYLRGEVYGFTIDDPRTGEQVDSCWGFYGVDEAKQEANDFADVYEHPRESTFARKAHAFHA